MFNIGPGELIVILIVALVLLGPDKLPEMARTVGKGMRELKRATEDIKDQVETEFYKLDDDKPRSPIIRPPAGIRTPGGPQARVLPAAPTSATTPNGEPVLPETPVASELPPKPEDPKNS